MREVEYLRPSLPKLGAKLYKMPYREMQMWSDLTTNPGIMGCVNVWDMKVLRSASGAHFKLQINKKLNWDTIKEKIGPNSRIYIADNHAVTMSCHENADKQNLAELVQTVPVLPYYGVNFRDDNHIVLIVGGETEGISEESYKLASDFKGVRLKIPLSNKVDSLNAGTALGIIVFEIKRQLSMIQEKMADKSDSYNY
ncbi:hypothetical protein NQ314_000135 [Rhamnusium bicolor]|uniref:tRNA/rRNA methyltransferase SpoU type domain-containing protein n=1 Tax=Rhamnusium bicolor TaxID=1586634 RepID=A0AAV8ZW74_9CUCU|nr:hypothetical protein NQ314_000135 [Rhamnusium bicolor]